MAELTVAELTCTDPAWMRNVCRRLSDVLGYELSFQPTADAEPASAVPASHLVWQSPEMEGPQLTGRLRLQTPQGTTLRTPAGEQPPDARVIHTAEIFAEVLQRLVVLERQLTEQVRDQLLSELDDQQIPGETLPQTVARMLRLASRTTSAWGTAFFLADGSSDQLRLRLCDGLETGVIPHPQRRLSQSPDEMAMLTGLQILTHDAARDRAWLPVGCRTAAVVPLRTTAGCLGSLWCFDRRNRGWLMPETRRLQLVASQLSARLERSVLRRESDARRQLSQELTSASRRHPGRALGQLPKDAGFAVAIRTASPAELGGDLCEVWPIGRRRTLFVVGDATGHSVPAALIMSVARGSLRTLLTAPPCELESTAIIAQRLNQALYSVTQGEQFMTLMAGIYDAATGSLRYTNAGHPPLWHFRGPQAQPLSARGIVLGVLEDAQYEMIETRLQPGDWLVGYTDGISEALSRRKEYFLHTGIVQAMQSQSWPTVESAADGIWQALQDHTSGQPSCDDQTLCVLRINR